MKRAGKGSVFRNSPAEKLMQDVPDHERQAASAQPLAGSGKSKGRWDTCRLPILCTVSVAYSFQICVGFRCTSVCNKEDKQARQHFSV